MLCFHYVVTLCTRHCTSVHPGRGIPPLPLFLRFLPFFLPVKRVFLWLSFSLADVRVALSRTEGVVSCTDCKAPRGKFVICDFGLYK